MTSCKMFGDRISIVTNYQCATTNFKTKLVFLMVALSLWIF